MKEPNKELDQALHIVYAFIDDYKNDCLRCSQYDYCTKVINESKSDFCIVENSFNIIHQEILRIKD